VAAILTVSGGAIAQARLALTGVGPTPLRVPEAEALLIGHALDAELMSRSMSAVRGAITPESDQHASSDYRRHLAGVLTVRALAAAWDRAIASAA
jgi:CO/xanthine dehydrogenase FAD-binding subunit